jgi:beta-glucosidase
MASQDSPSGVLNTTHEADAIRAHWMGGGGTWRIGGGGRTVDLSAAAQSGAALSITYRIDRAPTGAVTLGCGGTCAGAADVTKTFSRGPLHRWRTLAVPLSCFAGRSADLSMVEDPLVLRTSGALDLRIKDARLAPASLATCPT